MSGNTSASGGPLLPLPAGPQPLEGAALDDFLQGWIVGITGIAPTLVRPSWQTLTPSMPPTGPWCVFGIVERSQPESPTIIHDPIGLSGNGQDDFWRNETLILLTTWYDQGAAGQAANYASIMRDGCTIAQNREYLLAGGFDYGECSAPMTVPVLIKELWQYRIDTRFTLRRQVARAYPVENIVKVVGTIATQNGLLEPFVTVSE